MQLNISPKALKELQQVKSTLQALSPAMKGIVYGEMTIAVARRFAKEAKAIPGYQDRTGRLRKSIRAHRVDAEDQTGTTIKDGAAQAVIGGRTAPHAHLIEFGTEERVQKSTGRRVGRVKPVGMLQKAFDGYQSEATNDGLKAARRTFNKLVRVAKGKGKLSKRHARVIYG